MADRSPWAAMLALAQRLGVAPTAFWRLSLKEWRALSAPNENTLTRAVFEALAARFPDQQK